MAKDQINIRISPVGRRILDDLVRQTSRESMATRGRKTTQAEIVEEAIRLLAEKKSQKSANLA